MANRRITQFPSIEATDIVDQDIITLVQVFEIDPALRNKKLNFSGLRTYLDQFYINVGETDPFIVGNVLVSGYAVISGDLTAESNFLVSGESDFKQDVILRQDLLVGGDITVTGNISANQLDVLNVNTQFLEATSGNFTIATGTTIDFASGYFDIISGTTITGDSVGIQSGTVVDLTVTRGIDAVSGYFDYLEVGNAFVSGITISGNINANNINASGTISGATITGDLVNVAELNVTSGIFSSISGTAITGDIVLFTLATGNTVNAISGNFQNLSGTTITGESLQLTSGNFQNLTVANNITSDSLNAKFISGVSGEFQNLSGNTITGTTINAGIINVQTLNAVELEFSGDQQVSGDLTVLQNLYVFSGAYIGGPLEVTGIISGETITGQSGTFNTIVTAPTFSGGFATFTGLFISGNGNIGGNVIVGNDLTVSGDINASGVIISGITGLFASGTEAAPSISFINNTDTGFHNAAANEVRITTSGNDRLTVNSAGNVGIGTTAPGYALEVVKASPTYNRVAQFNSNSTVSLIAFGGSNGVGEFAPEIGQNNSTLVFNTQNQERTRIDVNGRLLVGTSTGRSTSTFNWISQIEGLNLTGLGITSNSNNANGAYLSLAKSRGTAVGSNTIVSEDDLLGGILFSGADGTDANTQGALIGCYVDGTPGANDMPGRLVFSTTADGASSPTERLRITSDGNVGIGTTAPEAILSIRPGSSAISTIGGRSINYGANLESTSGRSGFLVRVNNNFTANDDNSGFQWLFPFDSGGSSDYKVYRSATGSTLVDKFWVNQGGGGYFAGSVGIGTTSPSNILSIESAAPRIQITDTTTSGRFLIDCESSSGSVNMRVDQDNAVANSTFQVTIDNSEKLRITSDGNVGIGTSSPDALLEVRDTANSEIRISDTAGGYANLVYNESGTVSVFEIAADPANTSTPDTELRFSVDGNRVITCLNSGNVGIGTTAPQAALDINAAASTSPFIASINSGEAARIDSNGRLLVGTSNSRITGFGIIPKVQIEGVNAVTDAAQAITLNRTDNLGPRFVFAKSKGNTLNSNTIVAENDELGNIYFCGADGTDISTVGAAITANVDGTPGENDMPSRLVFSTTADGASTPTERMRITQNGDVLIGQTTTNTPGGGNTTAGHSINRNGTVYHSGLGGISLIVNRSTSDGAVQSLRRDGTQVGTISVTTSSTAYNTSSDYRLKENVVPLANAADRVNQLQVHRFNFIADPETTVDGFLAHEAQAVVPECVTGTKDEVDDEGNPVYQGIDQSKMVPLAVAAIQECIKRIEALETELALLKSGN